MVMRMNDQQQFRRVILVELNEITWRILTPLLAQGKLPAFAEFIRHGAKGTSVAPEEPPNLDPWISWTTVYTGRPQSEHGVKFLEQPPETVRGPRIWEIAADAGRSIGVFGSIMSWPPRRDVRGFWVPSTFSPSTETIPPELAPIQELNLSQTRAHSPVADGSNGRAGFLRQFFRLRRLGLRISTVASVAASCAKWLVRPGRKWEKVSLQPLVNLDFFESLYRKHRPDLSTFHSNHVAHYQHRHWRAMDPVPFLEKPSAREQRRFGTAIEYGYRMADRVLDRMWKLAGNDAIVIVASGLGQQPYVDEAFPDGRTIVRIRDIKQVLDLCGASGHCTPISMMAPQWNLQFADPAWQKKIEHSLSGAWIGSPDVPLFFVDVAGDTINFNIRQKLMRVLDLEAVCTFPETGRTIKLGELCATQDATPKEGYHDQKGVLLMRGPGIREGSDLGEFSTLDLAPTILHLMGIPQPAHMKGHVLEQVHSNSTSSQIGAPELSGSCPVSV
jgi:Type I phosphodiesterase / nucleotide pyrophosphatase